MNRLNSRLEKLEKALSPCVLTWESMLDGINRLDVTLKEIRNAHPDFCFSDEEMAGVCSGHISIEEILTGRLLFAVCCRSMRSLPGTTQATTRGCHDISAAGKETGKHTTSCMG
ncbi:hypothetical protein KL86DPRO_20504 [uncultured delta proteobacterium]|uniref:Uncharacterized protein n=1 Tax=uncultured delta proteobacterium TaxID=34034 RepID=A0A212K1D5_9DELT|nr:hypothetical protein KL86DPRO_20504 [uncultured delta proteobacterium]